jgi:hypothetical protein
VGVYDRRFGDCEGAMVGVVGYHEYWFLNMNHWTFCIWIEGAAGVSCPQISTGN